MTLTKNEITGTCSRNGIEHTFSLVIRGEQVDLYLDGSDDCESDGLETLQGMDTCTPDSKLPGFVGESGGW